MIKKEDLLKLVSECNTYDDCLRIVRKHIIHGTPFVFLDREEDFYEFRDCIAKKFNINFHEVLILGSAKLGYSYHKDSVFSKESDIDVALINENLFEWYYSNICNYQYEIDKGLITMTESERNEYNVFLQYLIKGWMRPDKLPAKLQILSMKQDWFDFFKSISYDKSSVGNYKVAGGLFKSYHYMEKYYSESLLKYKPINS